jgi:hypothetical protein
LVDVDIVKVMEVLHLIMSHEDHRYAAYVERDAIKAMLRAGIHQGGEAEETAKKVVDILGRHGFHEYGEVLRA